MGVRVCKSNKLRARAYSLIEMMVAAGIAAVLVIAGIYGFSYLSRIQGFERMKANLVHQHLDMQHRIRADLASAVKPNDFTNPLLPGVGSGISIPPTASDDYDFLEIYREPFSRYTVPASISNVPGATAGSFITKITITYPSDESARTASQKYFIDAFRNRDFFSLNNSSTMMIIKKLAGSYLDRSGPGSGERQSEITVQTPTTISTSSFGVLTHISALENINYAAFDNGLVRNGDIGSEEILAKGIFSFKISYGFQNRAVGLGTLCFPEGGQLLRHIADPAYLAHCPTATSRVTWKDVSMVNIDMAYQSAEKVDRYRPDQLGNGFSVENGYLMYRVNFRATPFTGAFEETGAMGEDMDCSPLLGAQYRCTERCNSKFNDVSRSSLFWKGYKSISNFCQCGMHENGTYQDPADWLWFDGHGGWWRNWYDLNPYEKTRGPFCFAPDAYGGEDGCALSWAVNFYHPGNFACKCVYREKANFMDNAHPDLFDTQKIIDRSTVINALTAGSAPSNFCKDVWAGYGTCDWYIATMTGTTSNPWNGICGCQTANVMDYGIDQNYSKTCNMAVTAQNPTAPVACPQNMDLTNPADPVYLLKNTITSGEYEMSNKLTDNDAQHCACLRDLQQNPIDGAWNNTDNPQPDWNAISHFSMVLMDFREFRAGDLHRDANGKIPVPGWTTRNALPLFGATGTRHPRYRYRLPDGTEHEKLANCSQAVSQRRYHAISNCVGPYTDDVNIGQLGTTDSYEDYSANPTFSTDPTASRYSKFCNGRCGAYGDQPEMDQNVEIRALRSLVSSRLSPGSPDPTSGRCPPPVASTTGSGTGGTGTEQ